MKLRFSRLATRRLEEIATYIRQHDPSAAIAIEQAIRNTCELIAVHPFAGRAVRPNLRRLVVPRTSYLIFYRVDERAQTIAIVTIRHSARRPLA